MPVDLAAASIPLDPAPSLGPPSSFPSTVGRRRSKMALRFGVAFLIGMLAALAIGVGALYAYDQQYVGRILPGVKVGDVNVSGMTEAEASAALSTAYAPLGEGHGLGCKAVTAATNASRMSSLDTFLHLNRWRASATISGVGGKPEIISRILYIDTHLSRL